MQILSTFVRPSGLFVQPRVPEKLHLRREVRELVGAAHTDVPVEMTYVLAVL